MARAVRATGRRYLVERPREGGGWRAATQRGLLRALPLALLLSFRRRAAAKSGASLPAREQALLLSFLVVVAITTRIFRAFVCLPFATDGAEPPAQRFYLADDLSVECDGLEYAKVASCAVAMSSRRHNACHHTLMTGVGGRLRRGYARAVAGWTHPLLLGAGLSPSPCLGPHLTSTSPPPRPLSPPTSAPFGSPPRPILAFVPPHLRPSGSVAGVGASPLRPALDPREPLHSPLSRVCHSAAPSS